MFKIGDLVRVVRAADETLSADAIGIIGHVVTVAVRGDVGQTPASPGIYVAHQSGDRAAISFFWPEELAPVEVIP